MASQDPYNLIKQELEQSVNQLQERFSRWSEFRPTNPHRNNTGEELERSSGSILWQLDELQHAINIANHDPVKFNLTDIELNNRQSWITNIRRQINTIQESVKSSVLRTEKLTNNSRHEQENQEFLSNQKLEQEMIIRQQDVELDHMEQAVSRIGHVGRTIHSELESQHELLNALDEDVDITGSRIKAAQMKIREVIQNSGGNCQVCTIVVLSMILLILIIIAVST
eukprot:g9229.t1